QRRVLRRDQELVPVGAEPVAGFDGGDLLVVVVVDVVGARGEAAEPRPLPPGEHRLPVVGLGAEVRRLLARGNRLEPDDVAVGVEDLRAVGVGGRASERREEDVAATEVALGGEDRYGRRRGTRLGRWEQRGGRHADERARYSDRD